MVKVDAPRARLLPGDAARDEGTGACRCQCADKAPT